MRISDSDYDFLLKQVIQNRIDICSLRLLLERIETTLVNFINQTGTIYKEEK